MGWLKKLWLSWMILSAAAICASCQELTSTLREGNRTCPGEEVFFTCTITSTSSVFALAWSSTEYIGQSNILQFSTTDIPGAMISIDENVTAMLTNNTNVNGVHILEITLRIVANEASVVTCSGTNGVAVSIEFSISALPGIPQRIDADEISRHADICIILVTWDLPANTAGADIDRYIVYIPSRNISVNVSSTISTLHIPNCGDDLRVQVAAMNRVGCVGMNSPAVRPILLDIHVPTTKGGSAITTSTTVDGSLSTGAIVGIVIGALAMGVLTTIITVLISCYVLYTKEVKRFAREDTNEFPMEPQNSKVTQLEQKMQETQQEQDERVKQLTLQLSSQQNKLNALEQQLTMIKQEMTQLERRERVTQLEGQVTQLRSELSSTQEELEALNQLQEMSSEDISSPWFVPSGQRSSEDILPQRLVPSGQRSASHQPGITVYSQVGSSASSASGVLKHN